jgi:formate C-acetyltransferase
LPFDPVSNGISPSNGAEKNGMTAALNSASLVGDYTFGVGVSLNMRITPEAIRTDRDIENLASALEAYFAMKGRMVQFLPVSAKTMKDAQRNPNNYPDLTVKVTGFSHRFNFIPKIFQDDIIARAEFNSLS